MQGEPLCPAMLDCVVAACSQIGDSSRAFETFAAYGNLGLPPGAQAYNAVLQGCINHGLIDSVPKVHTRALCMLTLAAPMHLCHADGVLQHREAASKQELCQVIYRKWVTVL